MSNDNKSKLRGEHGQHSHTQQPKQSKRGFIFYMLIITALFMLLLLASCQPTQTQGVTYEQRQP
ncbi:hypothetical protein [Psychrobacter frigidicola]|uniref:hypothetical protein n=1 Tax=Psychrobacter frigidicola TaxID=45611 RepID=UPI001918AFD1|nr:hypothetical protein [Psychrobacter frigidicola]